MMFVDGFLDILSSFFTLPDYGILFHLIKEVQLLQKFLPGKKLHFPANNLRLPHDPQVSDRLKRKNYFSASHRHC